MAGRLPQCGVNNDKDSFVFVPGGAGAVLLVTKAVACFIKES